MDGADLFRKLGSGAKFNFKRFQSDAQKLELIRPKKDIGGCTLNTEDFTRPDVCIEPVSKRIKEDNTRENNHSHIESPNEDNLSSDFEESFQQCEEPGTDLHILESIRSKGKVGQDSPQHKKKKSKKKTAEILGDLKQEKVNHFRRQNRIHVYGSDVPDPVETFKQLQVDYSLHHQVVANLEAVGFSTPTPIQMQAIPVMMKRREILACAPTGSGKTAAFILPILHHLVEPRRAGIRALILSPTRELAQQTYREFCRLSEGRGFRVHFIDKASASKKFTAKSSQKYDILVTTPNRLIFMLKQDPPMISLQAVEWLVVDESDKLFEEGKTGFRAQLAVIYKACNSKNVRRAMFSATFAYEVEQWCKLNLDNVVQVYVGARNTASETVEQELQFVGSECGKLLAVREIIRKGLQPPVLIFVQSKDRAKELFHELIYDGINVDVIHADRTQLQRDNIVKGFRAGKIWVLICTELMGRGIDFKGVNLVINYDFPNSAISYIHRIGRTGRAGQHGRAVTLFTESDAVNLRSIANVMREAGCPVPDYMLQMNRPSKKERRKLAKSAPKRKTIRTFPKGDLLKAKKKRKLLKKLEHRLDISKKASYEQQGRTGSSKEVAIFDKNSEKISSKKKTKLLHETFMKMQKSRKDLKKNSKKNSKKI